MSTISSSVFPLAVQNSTSSQQAASSTGSSTGSNSLGSINESEFLNLLVTQLQNQDPLNPIDSQDFASQLATFSSLDQLISINQAVTKLADGSGTQATSTGGTS